MTVRKNFQTWTSPLDPDEPAMGGVLGGALGDAPIAPVAGLSLRGMPSGSAMTSTSAAVPQTDWSNVAGAGIGAAGQTVGTIAQLAGQKAAMDSAMAQSAAGRALSEKLAKMQLAQNAEQFAKSQGLQGLMWALGANRAAIGTSGGGRDLRRQDEQMMGDLFARLYLKR